MMTSKKTSKILSLYKNNLKKLKFKYPPLSKPAERHFHITNRHQKIWYGRRLGTTHPLFEKVLQTAFSLKCFKLIDFL